MEMTADPSLGTAVWIMTTVQVAPHFSAKLYRDIHVTKSLWDRIQRTLDFRVRRGWT